MTKKQERVCKHCDQKISLDHTRRMWYTVEGNRFYCPRDTNADRCQHQPKD